MQILLDIIAPVFGIIGLGYAAARLGWFSKQATDKLEELFTTLFRTEKGGGDDQRADSLRRGNGDAPAGGKSKR